MVVPRALRRGPRLRLRRVGRDAGMPLGLHRPEAHAAMHAAYDAGNESEKALALWMRRLGLVS